ncbi:MAG: hypothetical protein SH850_00735 [Planctomycetaceae bacterium]|nr:hypothetical protein [Planctomycetaceae bacterium]
MVQPVVPSSAGISIRDAVETVLPRMFALGATPILEPHCQKPKPDRPSNVCAHNANMIPKLVALEKHQGQHQLDDGIEEEHEHAQLAHPRLILDFSRSALGANSFSG